MSETNTAEASTAQVAGNDVSRVQSGTTPVVRRTVARKAIVGGGQVAPQANSAQLLSRLNEAERLAAEYKAKLDASDTAPKPVSDAHFAKAESKALAITRKSEGEVKGTLNKVLGFPPALTDAQRASWRKTRKEIDRLHDGWTRKHAAEIRSQLDRARRLPSDKAVMAGKLRKSVKTGAVQAVSLAARFKLGGPKAGGKAKSKSGKPAAKATPAPVSEAPAQS